MQKSPFVLTALLSLLLSLGGCVWYGPHGHGYDHGGHYGGNGWHDDGGHNGGDWHGHP